MTARAAPIVLRLAMLYALLDGTAALGRGHLRAALALWDYAERSVDYLFGDRSGNAIAEKLLPAFRVYGELTRWQIRDVLGHNARRADVSDALDLLVRQRRITRIGRPAGPQGGRPTEVWGRVNAGPGVSA